jgi:hypothetical protein
MSCAEMNIRGLRGEAHVNLRILIRAVPLNPEYHEYDGRQSANSAGRKPNEWFIGRRLPSDNVYKSWPFS